ncbi:MAG TPA: histidine kinase [Prolixibacteraceae bacterium]|nr:histidine kinase [Prolixibacteraceae bacterium]
MMQIFKRLRFIKNIRQEQWVLFFVHLSVWMMLFVAFYLFSLLSNESLPVFIVLLYFYGFILFYLNYFFLTPIYLLPKKYLFFAVSILVVSLFSFLVVDPLIHQLSVNDFIRNAPHGFRVPPPFEKMPGVFPHSNKFSPPRVPMGMSFLLFVFLIFSSSVRIFQKLKREEDINQRYQHEKLNAELMLLRQQVNPHFLFNSLNNIYSLANRKSDLTSEAIMKLSSILRYMLSENPSKEIPVSREIFMIENYIDLQKLWMKDSVAVDFVVENINETRYIEPFILNPLVENAFKYGALPGVESTISIHLSMVGDWLHLKISNPIVREKLSEVGSLGIGVNNVIRRLELCYPGNYKLENARIGDNYLINLSMKLKNNELHSNR